MPALRRNYVYCACVDWFFYFLFIYLFLFLKHFYYQVTDMYRKVMMGDAAKVEKDWYSLSAEKNGVLALLSV